MCSWRWSVGAVVASQQCVNAVSVGMSVNLCVAACNS